MPDASLGAAIDGSTTPAAARIRSLKSWRWTGTGISRNGKYIVGTAPTKPTRVAVRWLNPLVP